jgi:hypothetical protein
LKNKHQDEQTKYEEQVWALKTYSYGMPSEISYCRTTNVFRIPCGTIKKNLNFPYANMKWLVWQQENTVFHNEKIRIKHWNIGPTIHLKSFPCVLLIQLQFVRGFHSFPYRECQKSLLCCT